MKRAFIVSLGLALLAASGCASELADSDPKSIDGGALPAFDGGLAPSLDAGGLRPEEYPCDPVGDQGCSTGEVCLWSAGPDCTTQTSSSALGEPCELGGCAPGLVCLRRTETSTLASCLKLCHLESGEGCETLPGSECRLQIDGRPWGACTSLPPACNPYTQSPCSPEQACQPFVERLGSRGFRCLEAGSQVGGEPCGSRDGDCARGFVCIAELDGSGATCRQFCEFNADCAAPEQCTGRADEPSFDFCLP